MVARSALGPQAEGTRSGFPPKTRAKGQVHVTDAVACMLHYTVQAPSDMHAGVGRNVSCAVADSA